MDSLDKYLDKLSRKILSVILGSGLLVNALYLFGLSFHEGYLKRMGFKPELFSLDWNQAFVWAYFASRHIGIELILLWSRLTTANLLCIFFVIYLAVRSVSIIFSKREQKKAKRLFQFLFITSKVRLPWARKLRLYLQSKVKNFPRGLKKIVRKIIDIFKFILFDKEALDSIAKSYFVFIGFLFIPIFIFIWVSFPRIGLNYGHDIAEKDIKHYSAFLCGEEKDYWDQCMEFKGIKVSEKLLSQATGRLVISKSNLVGVYTEEGPVTFQLQNGFYHQAQKNRKSGIAKPESNSSN